MMKKKVVLVLLVSILVACTPIQEDGQHALLNAIKADDTTEVLHLLEAGADTRLKNGAGQTPYDVAIEYEHYEIAQLLEAGYDPLSPVYILRKFESAANTKDLDTMMMFCAEDAAFGTIESAKWTDFRTNWETYIKSEIELEISNIQVYRENTILEIKWYSVGKYIFTQSWEATFEDGKIKTLFFLEEIDKASN
jgi:hypothetical protein